MSEKEYSLKEILDISGAIEALPNSGLKVEVKAAIALARNQQKLKPYVEGYNTSTKYPKEFDEYNKELKLVYDECAIKNSSGGYLTINRFIVYKDEEKAKAKIEKINEKYKDLLKEIEEINKKREVSLKEKHRIDLEEVKESSFSGSSESSVAIMMALMPITVK